MRSFARRATKRSSCHRKHRTYEAVRRYRYSVDRPARCNTGRAGFDVGFRKLRRHRRRRCPACQTRMVRLAEAEDDALLAEGQQAEERVASVDYDVWKCGACSHHFTLRYPKWFSGYAECPQCHNRTKSSTETVIEPRPPPAAERERRRAVRVLQLPHGSTPSPSAHLIVELFVVERLVELQQFRRRQFGRRWSQ